MTNLLTPFPPLSPHRQRKHDAMVKKILAAAQEIMREQGVAALSMHELARKMDLRASSLYHYFNSKIDVYDALFHLGFIRFGEHMRQVTQEANTWQDFVRQSFEGYLDFAKQYPELYQLCFERPVPGFVPSEESYRASTELLQHFYERAAKFQTSIHTNLSAEKMVDMLIAIMHGITAMHMANEPEMPPQQGRFGSLIPATLELLEKAWSTA